MTESQVLNLYRQREQVVIQMQQANAAIQQLQQQYNAINAELAAAEAAVQRAAQETSEEKQVSAGA